MRPLIEDAGKPWYAGWLSRVCRLSGTTRGTRWVGGRRLRWFAGPDDVMVLHADAAGQPINYPVPLTLTRLPSGGGRWWWRCPACGARVDVLYLPAGRDQLGCRRCCGLAYRSQYSGARARGNGRRPRVRVRVRGWQLLGRWRWIER